MIALESLAGKRIVDVKKRKTFYETFSAQDAFDLLQRFHMVYTPKKASWLNMAEIELSALSKQCLDRRLGNLRVFSKEVYAWARQRNRKKDYFLAVYKERCTGKT